MEGGSAVSTRRRLGFFKACRAHMTPEARRKSRIFTAWALAWAVAFDGSSFLFSSDMVGDGPLKWIVPVVPTVVGLLLVLSYVRFLRAADELLRKIHLEGLALGFGAAFVFMSGYRLFERAGAPSADISYPIFVCVVFWALGVWLGYRRYL